VLASAPAAGGKPLEIARKSIDRAWSCWQKLHPADAAPTASTTWMKDLKFTFYDVKFKDDGSLDPDGKKVEITGEQVIKTATQLGYVYDGDPCDMFEGAHLSRPARGRRCSS
jgi:hypothetical protein